MECVKQFLSPKVINLTIYPVYHLIMVGRFKWLNNKKENKNG